MHRRTNNTKKRHLKLFQHCKFIARKEVVNELTMKWKTEFSSTEMYGAEDRGKLMITEGKAVWPQDVIESHSVLQGRVKYTDPFFYLFCSKNCQQRRFNKPVVNFNSSFFFQITSNMKIPLCSLTWLLLVLSWVNVENIHCLFFFLGSF